MRKYVRKQPITTPKRLAYNTFFNVATLAGNAIIGFLLIRFFLGQLGEARYGVWLLIGGSIFRYAPLLNMGLNSSINRWIPVYLAENNEEGIQRVISTSFFTLSILAVVLAVASLAIYHNLGSWFAIKSELIPTAEVLVLVVGFCSAFATPLQLSNAILSGLQRYDIINLAIIIPLLLRTIVLVVLLLQGYGLLTMGLIFGANEITVKLLQFFFARRLLPKMLLSFGKIDFRLLRQMLTYGINTFLYALGAMIIYHASNLVIGIFIGTEQISQFAIATAGVFLLSQLVEAFTAAIKPAVSDLDARGDKSRVREIAFLTQKFSLLLIIPSGCFLVAMGREFLSIWVGGKFQDPAVINTMGAVLAILATGHCFRLSQHSNFLVLVGRGQHKIFGVMTGLTALFCVSASVVSVKVFNWGLLGIAWSNFLPMVIFSMILQIYFNSKMEISVPESVRSVWQPAFLGSLPTVIMIVVLKYLAPPNSWSEIVCVILPSIALTVVSVWFLSLKGSERRRFVHIAIGK